MSEVGKHVCCACELGYHDLCERGHMTNGACLCCMENSLTLIEKDERKKPMSRTVKEILVEMQEHNDAVDLLVDELRDVFGIEDDRDVKSCPEDEEKKEDPELKPVDLPFDMDELEKILKKNNRTYPPFMPTYPSYPPFYPETPVMPDYPYPNPYAPTYIGTPPPGDYTITCSFTAGESS